VSTLERAIGIAARAHAGQTDKAGAPYILHPLRVMLRLSTIDEQIVGVLHDVIEDSGVAFEDLRLAGFGDTVVDAIGSVTRRDGETYDEFVMRAASNPIGHAVKLADLEDNCDLTRIAAPTDRDYARVEKYRRAIGTIREMERSGGCQE